MAKDKSPAFQLYAADFFVDTAGWTAAQVGAYFRLLLTEWVNGPLSSKITDLARIAGVDHRNMQKMWSMVIAKKFTVNDAGMYINLRLEETRKEQEEWREKQRESGLRGAKERWKDKQNNDGNPIGNPNGENMALQSSSSSSIKKDLKASFNNQGDNGKSAFAEKLKEAEKYAPTCKEIEKTANILHAKGIWNRARIWAQMKLQLQNHPEAVLKSLKQVLEYKPKSQESYAEKILSIENGNANEAEHIAKSQALKNSTPTLQEALKGAIHGSMSGEMPWLPEDE
jgi:uncharacterized protein YdaU (DUF1376 family)